MRMRNLVLATLAALAALAGTATMAVAAITPVGDVVPWPTPAAPWTTGTTGYVGKTIVGVNTLTVDNTDADSNLFSKKGYIGNDAGVTGTLTVTGKGSTWTNDTSYIYVGESGTGYLDILSGGYVKSKYAYIGDLAGSAGYVKVSGAEDGTDSLWENTSSSYIGKAGHGELLVESGGDAILTGTCYVGSTGVQEGKVKVTGDGSTMSTGTLYVGHNGIGTMDVEDHGVVTSSAGTVAFGSGSTSIATVTGTGSKWTNTGALTVGLQGNGTLNIENGGTLESTDGYIGKQKTTTYTGTGLVKVDGAASTWTASKAIYVGYETGSIGTLNLVNNGTVSAQTLYASSSDLTGTGAINTRGLVGDNIDLVFDSTHGLSQTLTFGGVAISLDMTGGSGAVGDLGAGYRGTGTLTIDDGLAVNSISGYVGFMGGSTGTATVTGGGSWTMSSNLKVGYYGAGELYVTNGGSVTNAAADLGFGLNYGVSAGTATVDGPDSIWTSTGTVTLGTSTSATNKATGTLHLDNEGTLCANKVQASDTQGGIGIAKVYFDGGVLKPYDAANSAWISLGTSPHADSGVWIKEGGAVFDTAGFDMGIAVALQHGSGFPDGGLTKQGAGKLTLSGANAYTGRTILEAGTLQLGTAADDVVLAGGGAEIKTQTGKLVFDYAGGSTPALTIRGLLAVSYASGWTGGQFLCPIADSAHGLGWYEDAGAQTVTLQYAFYGDANLDNTVDLSDLTLLGQNWRGAGKAWVDGDFNYDGAVDLSDLTLLGQNWRATATGKSFGEALTLVNFVEVPEPGTLVLLACGLAGLLCYAWRRRK